jgi:hypothetical protein
VSLLRTLIAEDEARRRQQNALRRLMRRPLQPVNAGNLHALFASGAFSRILSQRFRETDVEFTGTAASCASVRRTPRPARETERGCLQAI